MVPVRMKKPSKPEFWVLFPPLLPSFFPFNSSRSLRCVRKPWKRSTGGKPRKKLHGLSQWGSFPSHNQGAVWKGRLENVKQRIVSWRLALTSLIHLVEFLLGELSHDASRWIWKVQTDPPEVWKRSKNRFLGEIFITKYLQTGPLQLFFFPFFPVVETLNHRGFSNQQKKEGRDSGGREWWFSVGVILSLGGRPQVCLFSFLFDMYRGNHWLYFQINKI